MPRSAAELLTVAMLGVVCASCALGDGRPWGTIDVAATVDFAPSDARLDDTDRLKTARDYRVALDALEVDVSAARLIFDSADSAGFDPSDPPEGYSLCHNGHCHADDGRLVDYADIAAEVASSSSGSSVVVTFDLAVELGSNPVALPVTDCSDDCVAPRGQASSLTLTFDAVRARGTAFDARQGDDARLPDEGVPFELETLEPVVLAVQLEPPLSFDESDPNDVLLMIEATLSEALLDAVDFATLADEPGQANAAFQLSVADSILAAKAQPHGDAP